MRIVVNDWDYVLLFRNGIYAGTLAPGSHNFTFTLDDITHQRLPRRLWLTEAGIDVTSADRFPLRLSVSARCEVTDPKLAFDEDYLVAGKRALNAAAAHAAAAMPLDALVVGREVLAEALAARLEASVAGCALSAVQITAVTLPPEVRRLFTDVERVRRENEAGLERARGEHASLRALANAARLLRGNPELMNLRLLQAVNAGQKSATLVLGGTALAPVSAAGALPPDAEGDA